MSGKFLWKHLFLRTILEDSKFLYCFFWEISISLSKVFAKLWHPTVLVFLLQLRKFCFVLLCNFIEMALRHRCSPVILLHISRTSFPRNTSEWLLLLVESTLATSQNTIWMAFRFLIPSNSHQLPCFFFSS